MSEVHDVSIVERSNPSPRTDQRKSPLVQFVIRFPTLILLVLLVVVFSFASPQFLTSANLTSVISTQAVVTIVTFAAILPLVVGEFDLSLGYLLGFSAVVGGHFSGQGWNAAAVIGVMLVTGLIVGLINGILTVRFGVSGFIGTLGIGIILSGLVTAISGGEVLYSGIPDDVISIGRGEFLGLGVSLWLTLIIAALLVYLYEHTPLGRRWYAVGGSERVAFLAGIRTGRVKILAFVAAGLLVGVAAVFQLGQAGAASPSFGPEVLLPAYAGAFLGVVSYRPGYFNVPGALIAVALLAVGFNGLSLLGVPTWGQPVFNGVVLLIAVLTARAESRRLKVG